MLSVLYQVVENRVSRRVKEPHADKFVYYRWNVMTGALVIFLLLYYQSIFLRPLRFKFVLLFSVLNKKILRSLRKKKGLFTEKCVFHCFTVKD